MSIRRELFRREAVEHRGKPEPLDGLLRVTAPHEWAILGALALAALGMAAWMLLGTVERDFTGGCALVLTGERYPVFSGTTGSVAEVLAGEGDPIEAGQPLARVRLHELDHEVSVAQARVALIERHVEAGDTAFLGVLSTAQAELVDLEARRESGGQVVSPYSGEITALNLRPEQEVTQGVEVAMVRSLRERRFQAVALVSMEDAQKLEAGMESRVVLPAGDRGKEKVLEAEVDRVSDRPIAPGGWLESLGLESPASGAYLLTQNLTEPAPNMVTDGDSCQMRVILSREPPIGLLGSPSRTR